MQGVVTPATQCYAIHEILPTFCPNKGLYFDTINFLQRYIDRNLTWVNNCHILVMY